MWCGRQTCTVLLTLTGFGREDRSALTSHPATLRRYKNLFPKSSLKVVLLLAILLQHNFDSISRSFYICVLWLFPLIQHIVEGIILKHSLKLLWLKAQVTVSLLTGTRWCAVTMATRWSSTSATCGRCLPRWWALLHWSALLLTSGYTQSHPLYLVIYVLGWAVHWCPIVPQNGFCNTAITVINQ